MTTTATNTLRTPLCEQLGIELPVISAGMGPIAGSELVAAVSNAGGLGVLGCTGMSAEEMRAVIRRTRELTSRPFGVDLILPARLEQSGTRMSTSSSTHWRCRCNLSRPGWSWARWPPIVAAARACP